MKQYHVPQFITVEDKVIGGILTIKQFLFLAGGAGAIALLRAVLDFYLFVPLATLVGGLAASLAFLKISEVPFPTIVKNAMMYGIRPRLYVWKKQPPQKIKKAGPVQTAEPEIRAIPKLSESKLQDLAWSLDVKEKYRE